MDKLGKVFMLDDDFILLDMYRSLLESHGFDVLRQIMPISLFCMPGRFIRIFLFSTLTCR